jgi:peptide/nickel transport system permease protein
MHISIRGQFRTNRFGQAGVVIALLMGALALLSPVLAPDDPNHQTREAFEAPSSEHILGTNHVGQDNWSRLLHGARTSLLVGLLASSAATVLGLLVGGSCAMRGGFYDAVVMRFVDALLIIPAIIVLILVAAYVNPRLPLLITLISLLTWAGGARIMRAQTLSLKERPHIEAARTFGGHGWYVMHRHIVPDLGPILVVEFIHGFRRAVFMEAGLAFLGIGDPTTVSWGSIMKNAVDYSYMGVWGWWLVPAGLALSLTILSLAFIGHTLEPLMEPRLMEEAGA